MDDCPKQNILEFLNEDVSEIYQSDSVIDKLDRFVTEGNYFDEDVPENGIIPSLFIQPIVFCLLLIRVEPSFVNLKV